MTDNDNKPTTLLSGAIATGRGISFTITENMTFQAVLTGTTANQNLAATISIGVSNDGAHWIELGEIDLSVTDWDDTSEDVTDGFYAEEAAKWAYASANVSAISGTGATVSAYMGK